MRRYAPLVLAFLIGATLGTATSFYLNGRAESYARQLRECETKLDEVAK